MKVLLNLSILLFLFSGCATKTVYIKPKCQAFKQVIQPFPRTILVKNESLPLYRKYIGEFRTKINFMNKQVELYQLQCK